MKSKATNRLTAFFIIIGLIAILVAGYFTYTYLDAMKTTVYVFNGDYAAGTVIDKDMLSTMQVDTKIVANAKEGDVSMQYVTKSGLETVLQSGDALLVDVKKGTTLMPWLLTANGGGAVQNNLTGNMVAITIPVNNYSGVTNDLRIGSKLNIYSTSSYDTSRTYLLLENMQVIGTQTTNDATLNAITFACTPEQALKLLHANTFEQIYCGLINESTYELSGDSTSGDNKTQNQYESNESGNPSLMDPQTYDNLFSDDPNTGSSDEGANGEGGNAVAPKTGDTGSAASSPNPTPEPKQSQASAAPVTPAQ